MHTQESNASPTTALSCILYSQLFSVVKLRALPPSLSATPLSLCVAAGIYLFALCGCRFISLLFVCLQVLYPTEGHGLQSHTQAGSQAGEPSGVSTLLGCLVCSRSHTQTHTQAPGPGRTGRRRRVAVQGKVPLGWVRVGLMLGWLCGGS